MHPTLCDAAVDDRVIEAMWEVIEAMHPAFRYQLRTPSTDGIAAGEGANEPLVIDAKDFTFDLLQEHGFIDGVCWQDPSSHGGRARYLLMEIVPEGIAVTHHSNWIGKIILGLPGMPMGISVTSPAKITYVTVAPEGFASAILRRLQK